MKSQSDNRVLFVIGLGVMLLLGAGCNARADGTTPAPVEAAVPTPVIAASSATLDPTPSTEAGDPLTLAQAGVEHNAEWTPYTYEIKGVLMALVPAGCFQMGAIAGDADERPVHKVCFEEPFWMDVYEVTNAQYGSTGCADFSPDPDQPRNCVDWSDALAHCEARGARLPTEAEWEYAARGPDALVYPWGNAFVDKNAIWGYNSDRRPAPAGSLPEGMSWVGAYDLSGNVWEWVNDWYSGNYYESLPDGVVDPQGPPGGTYRVRRGSSFLYESADGLRATFRGRVIFEAVDDGFRCAQPYAP